MKKIIGKQFTIVAAFIMLFANIITVDAASTAKVSVSGPATMNTGTTATEKIVIGNISGSVNAVSGTVTVSDNTCVSIGSMTGLNGTSAAGSDFILASFSGITANTDMLSLSVTAGNSPCTATIKVSDIAIGFMNGDTLEPSDTTFTITVGTPAAKSSDNTLKALSPDKGTLSPEFNKNTTSYTIEVPEGTTAVNFTATPNDTKATVSGKSCTLTGASTTCTIKVTAEDGSTKSYTVKVTRPESSEPTPDPEPTPTPEPTPAPESRLKSLDLEGFSLSPKFNPDEKTYSITVANQVTGLDVKAIPMDADSKVTVTGNDGWKVGTNVVTIVVTSADGTTSTTYKVNVNRKNETGSDKKAEDPKSNDNFLKDIQVLNGDLKPGFSKTVTSYSIIVGNEVTSLNLDAIKNNEKAKVKIEGNENFIVGHNTVTITVTAEDGSERVYTIDVERLKEESKTKLKEITIGGGYPLSPKFDPDTDEYEIDVKDDIDKLDITAIPVDPNSKVEIIGNEKLQNGTNKILIKVTDENGLVKYYRLKVNKNASKKFLGLTFKQWLIFGSLFLLLGIILLLLFLLKRRKKDEEKVEEVKTPVIEFNPEFNFGSKNGTDDDYVESGGVLNQYSGAIPVQTEEPKQIPATAVTVEDAKQEDAPFDYYDDKVTKEELLAAIEEAKRTKDSSKLKMLYKQEMLNREKEALKRKDQ